MSLSNFINLEEIGKNKLILQEQAREHMEVYLK